MALTVNRALEDFLLCGLPEYLGLTTDRTIITAGTPAKMTINIPGNLNDGDTMRLKWIGNDHTFEIKTVPDDSGFQLPEVSSPATFNDFIAALEANYYVDQDFTINVTSGAAPYAFELIARKNGANYTMDASVEARMTITTIGVDDVYAENFSVFAQVYAILDVDPEVINVIDAAVSNDSTLKLFFGPSLKAVITPSLPYTIIAGAGVDKYYRELTGAFVRYFVKYYERYGNPTVAAILHEWGSAADLKLAFNFTLDKTEIPNNTAVANHFTDTAARKVFKNITTKRFRAGYVDFLSVYIKAGSSGGASCKTDYYFTDASSSLGVLTFGQKTTAVPIDDHIYEFAIVADAALAYAVTQGKTIDYIEVYVESTIGGGTTVVTEKIRYELDSSTAENLHIFLYKNPKGCWDTVYFTGHIKNMREYQRVEAQIKNNPDFDQSVSEIFTYNHLEQAIYEVATGLLLPEELEKLDEFANSDTVYFLDGDFDTNDAFWRSVILEPDAFTELESSEGESESKLFRFKNAFYE